MASKIKSILKWTIKHVRPWFTRSTRKKVEKDNIIEDVKENTGVGIKIKFKF